MTTNTKRVIAYFVFALGPFLGMLGWMGDVYASSVGTILFIVFILASIALRIMWGLKK